jgi:hypothetical protein
MDAITEERFRKLHESIYSRNCVGCCLHIVLDDDNITNDDIEFCLDFAKETPNKNWPDDNHADCVEMAELLLSLTVGERVGIMGLDPSDYDIEGVSLIDENATYL